MNERTERQPVAPAPDLDALMERIRAEVAERKQVAAPNSPLQLPQSPASDFATRNWSASALLSLPATDFARATHLAFFGREPSPEELVRLRDRLLVESVGRMRILREFHRSREARQRKLPIEGLTREFVRDRLYWSPPAKFGRFIGRGARNLWLVRRNFRKFVDRVEMLERRTVEITAAVRNLQSAQLNDRQNSNKHFRRLQETLETDNRRASVRIDETRDALNDLSSRLVDHWRTITEHRFELQSLAGALQPAAEVAAKSVTVRPAQDNAHSLDPLYLSFEDRYRGTRAEIKERQRIYVARVEAAHAATGHGLAVDIGCGRGEWLELLSEVRISGRGYDMNRIAVEECRERGLNVELGDGIEALVALGGESSSVVTAFHIVEHLPFESVVKLLDQSLRVLRPGGILILETPNPANLLVAAERFYFDPTHRNPLPSELTQYLLRSRGFDKVEILPLHQVPTASREEYADPMLRLLQEKLYGPQDYGAIGRKSA